MTGGCDLIRVSLGAYVVDALDSGERAPVAAHLERCEDCRSELAELSEVAGLLRRVPLREVERRVRWRPAAVAVAALAAAVAAVFALGSPGGGDHSPYPRSTLTASGTDRATHVFARVTLQRRVWGTAATLSMRGVRPHLRCRLVILERNGTRELVASYRTDPDGTADVTARSAAPLATIASLEVLAGQGQRVVQLPVRGSSSPA